MELLSDADTWISLLSLTAMEIVLGIDNIVFIAILTGKLPKERQAFARRIGLLAAMVMRLLLLFSVSWLMSLTAPLFSMFSRAFSGRDIILAVGGLFLLAKATHEIHARLEVPEPGSEAEARQATTVASVITQIMALDAVFSLDSVITAVGMAKHVAVMATAMIVAVLVMLVFSGMVAAFIDKNPTIKVLALSFMILIGVMLTAESVGHHIERGYIYFAMAFSFGVELINMRARRARHVRLNPHAPK